MSLKIMLVLPEVAYLVDRVPMAKLMLKPDEIHLRFCQHAKESNMSLKEQCNILGIPWHARKIHKELVSQAALDIAKALPPSVFAQTYPSEMIPAKHWLSMVKVFITAADDKKLWMAQNALESRRWWSDIKPYLTALQSVPSSLKASTMADRAKEWKAEQIRIRERANELQREQMNMMMNLQYQMMNDPFGYYNGIAGIQRVQNDIRNNPYYAQAHREYGGGLFQNAPLPRAIADNTPIAYDADKLAEFKSGKFAVKLLNTHDQFSEEGKRMHHCVEQYFHRAKAGICHIVSVSEGGERIVTAEFTRDWELVQAKGATNRRVEGNEASVKALRAYAEHQKEPKPEPVQVALPPPADVVLPKPKWKFSDPMTWGRGDS